jgi:hypothetical protein
MTSNGTTYLQQKWENCIGQTWNAQNKIGDNALGRAKTSEWYFPFTHQETAVDVCECSGCPTTGCTDKKMERVHSIINKDQWSTTLVIAGRFTPHIWHISTNFKGRTENLTYLCKVCDYVAHQWDKAEVILGTEIMVEVPHTSDWVPCFQE